MSEGDQFLDQRIVFVFLCSTGFPAEGSLVLKHVAL